MRASTKKIHNKLQKLGKDMGFIAEQEVSTSLLSLRLPEAYQPRIDLMWSLEIDNRKREAIACVTGREIKGLHHLPVVGIEVEGSGPSTKTMLSDLANIKTLGTPLGMLVVATDKEKDIYRRAARAIRTMRFNLGNLNVFPLEAKWLDGLLKQKWPADVTHVKKPGRKKPRGGETLGWEKITRKKLKKLGESAGFIVAEPFIPQAQNAKFKEETARRSETMRHMWDSEKRSFKEIRKSRDYFTACEIDMAWLMPMPRALRQMLETVSDMDPCLREHDILYPDIWDYVPVIGFELESGSGKHAGGALINLSSYCVIGVVHTPEGSGVRALNKKLETYVQALGLQNIFIGGVK